MREQKLAVSYMLHDDHWYLTESILSFSGAGKVFAFISKEPWNGEIGDWEQTVKVVESVGAEVVIGKWKDETTQRNDILRFLAGEGYTHTLIPVGDEIIEKNLLDALIATAQNNLADLVYVEWDTYWKTPEYVIRPREHFKPTILVSTENAKSIKARIYEAPRKLFLSCEYGIIHHLSYVGPGTRIKRKIETWSHRDEILKDWYKNVWLTWDDDKLIRNLHPTHPAAYQFAEKIFSPSILESAFQKFHINEKDTENNINPTLRKQWPTISVVIPLHGGEEDIRLCLESLEQSKDILHEVIVIDNASPDNAPEVVKQFDYVTLLQNETNEGFARASNKGFEASTGEVILFLNSDAIVPRVALIHLIQSLLKSGTIGASAPYTNFACNQQRILPTYTSLDTLGLFAENFSQQDRQDIEVDLLIGFCLAVKRSVLKELGVFDEKFGIGSFEDFDLCYRMRRAGYKLVISSQSYVHHHGSQTFNRIAIDASELLGKNGEYYKNKWRLDIESGFASHLPPFNWQPVIFEPAKKPETRIRLLQSLAEKSNISLCMIVKNEEKVLKNALESAKPFFSQIIVVDTGSIDATVEIARTCGAEVYEFPWTDSFADARNESLKYAKGDWIFWMDADDTLPWRSGEAIIHAALTAPKNIIGFVVPVQFIDDSDCYSGVRVDHVKLFRNVSCVQFEGRIHEQVLPSLRKTGGEIARCNAVVLHSGYDYSKEGQMKKRERDTRILELELKERPDHPFVLFNCGMTYHYCEEHEKAIEFLKKSIEKANPNDSFLRKSFVLLGASYIKQNNIQQAIETFQQGLRVVGDDPELYFHLGCVLSQSNRLAEAKTAYIKALQINTSDFFTSYDIGIQGVKSFHNLGLVSLDLGNYPEARSWWQKALKTAPTYLLSAFTLFDAALNYKDYRTASTMIEHVRNIEGMSESWANMNFRYQESLNGEDAAIQFLSELSHTSNSIAPAMVLVRTLLKKERESEAIPLLLKLANAGNSEASYYLGVHEIRNGNLINALNWMKRAQQLNPEHEETKVQLERLKKAVEGGER